MNERQKEYLLAHWTDYWEECKVSPLVERNEKGEIVSFRFQHSGEDVIYPFCWCGLPKCLDCKNTKFHIQEFKMRCNFNCSKIKKCPFCM